MDDVSHINYIWLILAGLGGGFLAGLLGIGGGIIYILILPLALRNAGVPEQEMAQYIIANSIFGTAVAALSGSITLILQKEFYWKEVYLVSAFGVLVSYLILFTVVNTPYYSERNFNFAVVFFLLAILFTSFRKQQLFFKKPVRHQQRWHMITGSLAGMVSALSGLGGGTVVVPLLKSGLHMDIKKAKSVSLGVILIMSGFISIYNMLDTPAYTFEKLSIGYVVVPVVFPLSIGVVLSSPLGVKMSGKISSDIISYIFAGFLVLVIVRKAISLIQTFYYPL